MVERPVLRQSRLLEVQTPEELCQVRLCQRILVVLPAILPVENFQIHLVPRLLPQALRVRQVALVPLVEIPVRVQNEDEPE